jgi:2-amino-4-hydroxy-6-hydroxymethyldihydropteridine diphosphokinase
MNQVVLLLGTNEGELLNNLKAARNYISELSNIIRFSGIYKTAPWGKKDQADFLNQVIQIETELTAIDLLSRILKIELLMGRERKVKWESRLIDIDILYFNDEIIQEQNLTIPHKHLHERRFVLEPLAEILPDQIHPILKKNNVELSKDLKDDLNVELLTSTASTSSVNTSTNSVSK